MFFYLQFFFHICLIFGLVVLQYSFVEVLPFWLGYTNILIVALIFVSSLKGRNYILFWGGGMGVALDIYSFLPFGIFTVVFMAVASFIYLLSNSFFTNRSLYSFWALTIFATFFCQFLFEFLRYFLEIFNSEAKFFLLQSDFWSSLAKAGVMNLLLMLVLFYIFNFVSNRFRPVFIRK
jgi:cell shape-determining protein MreD